MLTSKLKAINNFTIEDFRNTFGSLCKDIPDDRINDILEVTKLLAMFAFDVQNFEELRKWKQKSSKDAKNL